MDFSKLNVKTLDRTKLDKGVNLEYQKGVFFKLRRAGNAEYRKAISERWASIENDDITNDEAAEILSELMIRHCVVGWSGLSFDGDDFPYSADSAIEMLMAPEASEIRDWIDAQTSEVENFRSKKQKK